MTEDELLETEELLLAAHRVFKEEAQKLVKHFAKEAPLKDHDLDHLTPEDFADCSAVSSLFEHISKVTEKVPEPARNILPGTADMIVRGRFQSEFLLKKGYSGDCALWASVNNFFYLQSMCFFTDYRHLDLLKQSARKIGEDRYLGESVGNRVEGETEKERETIKNRVARKQANRSKARLVNRAIFFLNSFEGYAVNKASGIYERVGEILGISESTAIKFYGQLKGQSRANEKKSFMTFDYYTAEKDPEAFIGKLLNESRELFPK